jgi:hypothetical protein
MPADRSAMTLTALASVRQHATAALEPGEEYVAAMRIADPDNGRPLRDPILGPVGMLFGAGKQALLEPVATTTLPSTGGIVVVTTTRVLVFGLGFRLGPTELLATADRTALTLATETFHASLVRRERIRVFDAEALFLDASVRASNPDLPAIRELIPTAS